jgi:hypothetical protein
MRDCGVSRREADRRLEEKNRGVSQLRAHAIAAGSPLDDITLM